MANYEDTRINKIRIYLFEIIEEIINDSNFQINADMLSNEINNYSLNKMPVQREITKFITGKTIYRDVFSFRSRKAYSQDVINNLENVGFFEIFEKLISKKNRQKILPDFEGVESIECLNNGTMIIASTKDAIFDIQIQITYSVDDAEEVVSL